MRGAAPPVKIYLRQGHFLRDPVLKFRQGRVSDPAELAGPRVLAVRPLRGSWPDVAPQAALGRLTWLA
jgi:hypothetical protein